MASKGVSGLQYQKDLEAILKPSIKNKPEKQ
jgi:hypothetical protein